MVQQPPPGWEEPQVVGASFDYPAGTTIDPHSHPSHQLVYGTCGVMRVRAGNTAWIVPPNRALWVPAGVEHEIRTTGYVRMRTLYSMTRLCSALPERDECTMLTVPPLLQALIVDLIDIQSGGSRPQREEHVVALIFDELQLMPARSLYVPWPSDQRLRRVCEAMQADPGSALTSGEWAARFGLSAKTLERDFGKNLGMTFGRWRQQLRLLAAVEQIGAGQPVTGVALDLGYRSPSSFSAMFRRTLGITPSQYFL
jgi:AraC-like DNA-binding protein